MLKLGNHPQSLKSIFVLPECICDFIFLQDISFFSVILVTSDLGDLMFLLPVLSSLLLSSSSSSSSSSCSSSLRLLHLSLRVNV